VCGFFCGKRSVNIAYCAFVLLVIQASFIVWYVCTCRWEWLKYGFVVCVYVIDLLLCTRCGILTLYICVTYSSSVGFWAMDIMCSYDDFSVISQVCPLYISFYIKCGEMKWKLLLIQFKYFKKLKWLGIFGGRFYSGSFVWNRDLSWNFF
jgi:hypothetical protein